MKFPIGIQDFKSIRNDGFVYVDKTALLYKMANEGKTYAMAPNRPITEGGGGECPLQIANWKET